MWKLSFYIMLFCVLNSAPMLVQGEENDDDDVLQPCTCDAHENCTCVPFYRCVEGIIEDDYERYVNPKQNPQNEENGVECGPYHLCCAPPTRKATDKFMCGKRNPDGVPNIIGRVMTRNNSGEAEFGEWPWQAVVLQASSDKLLFMCGGTLINNRHVLTVAHCAEKLLVFNNMSNIVRLGEWNTQSDDEFLPVEDYDVSEIIIHPSYRRRNLFNDIAILKLDRDVNFTPHINPVCLPKADDNFVGQICTVTGWGTDQYRNGTFAKILNEVSLPIITKTRCQRMLRRTRLGRFFLLHNGFMCAGGKAGEDACFGDGGGPLVCLNSDNTYSVAGLVSWGIECGHARIPGVYVSVQMYLDWIDFHTDSDI